MKFDFILLFFNNVRFINNVFGVLIKKLLSEKC